VTPATAPSTNFRPIIAVHRPIVVELPLLFHSPSASRQVGIRAPRSAPTEDDTDPAALLDAAESFAAIGALLYAMEAATAFLRAGRQDSARRAAARASELHQPEQGTSPPTIDGLDGTAIDLTGREAQIVDLARQGLSNAQIADRLVVSRRTVEGHIYKAMIKLGVNDRQLL
jgi:DNA-binding NarL/FixJ family response regulator